MFSNYKQISIKGPTSKIYSIGWSRDGKYLAVGTLDGKIRAWKPESSVKEYIDLAGHSTHVTQLIWSPVSNDLLATTSLDKTLRIWNITTKSQVQLIQTPGGNINMSWSPDGECIAVGNKDDWLSIIHLKTGKISFHKNFNMEINEMCWDVTSKRLFLSTGKGKINVLSYPKMELVHELEGHTSSCYSLAKDPMGRYLVSGGSDAMTFLWDVEKYLSVNAFDDLDYPIRALGFSYDGRYFAATSEDKVVNIYETQTGELETSLKVSSVMNGISWHPSTYVLAFAGDEKESRGPEFTVRLFVPGPRK
ncbi:hypothetical protein BB559_000844 [Furculomyces boomerangus]|uniref:Uncharacterized protein n=2 Tax=Harpellales TaxID=61421 RepID=A0A2T9Z416_9FUNG|nr:hypothetical protein BB559_000844 [Furculomyces boomerangus]PWA03380.1 hypothetical protein BB558_000454 [Smittium angustum]